MKRQPRRRRSYRGFGESFTQARLIAGFNKSVTAKALRVTTRTVSNWESGRTEVPYAAFKLLRILGGYALPGEAWKGWCIRGDTLWSPTQRGFQAASMSYLGLVFSMARQWLREHGQPTGLPVDAVTSAQQVSHGRVRRRIAPGNLRGTGERAQPAPGVGKGERDLPGQPLPSPRAIDLPENAAWSLGLSLLYNKSLPEGPFHREKDDPSKGGNQA